MMPSTTPAGGARILVVKAVLVEAPFSAPRVHEEVRQKLLRCAAEPEHVTSSALHS